MPQAYMAWLGIADHVAILAVELWPAEQGIFEILSGLNKFINRFILTYT
ncbi:hypothetical protein GF323_02950 [Candidatus Woesearchaeota archaeon]|nr:hypothetical protein [Candidatus Woesearchaeota archaeon]